MRSRQSSNTPFSTRLRERQLNYVSIPEFKNPEISRLHISNAYYLKGDGTTTPSVVTLLTANANVATIGTSVASDTTPNSLTTFGYQTTGPITGKGAYLWLLGSSGVPDSVVSSFVVETSTDSTDWVNGTWNAIPFTPRKPSGESSTATFLTRGQLIRIPAGPQCKIRAKFTKDNNASARTLRVALFQRPAQGTPDDLVMLSGPSLMSPHSVLDMRTSLRTVNTARDPIIVNMARAGAVASDVVSETVVDGLTYYPDAGTLILDIGGNDITNNRPYSPTQQHLLNALSAASAAISNHPDCMPFLQSVTWRNYPAPNAVNDLLNPENGSKPYNDEQIYPWMRANQPWVWNAALGIPRLDLYSAIMFGGPSEMNADGIHLITAGNARYRLAGFVEAYLRRTSGDWSRPSYVEQLIIAAETAATITEATKTRLRACIDQWPVTQQAEQISARNSLVARLNAIAVNG